MLFVCRTSTRWWWQACVRVRLFCIYICVVCVRVRARLSWDFFFFFFFLLWNTKTMTQSGSTTETSRSRLFFYIYFSKKEKRETLVADAKATPSTIAFVLSTHPMMPRFSLTSTLFFLFFFHRPSFSFFFLVFFLLSFFSSPWIMSNLRVLLYRTLAYCDDRQHETLEQAVAYVFQLVFHLLSTCGSSLLKVLQ